MVIMLKIMITMLILPIKAAPRLIFRRRTATPNSYPKPNYLTNTFTDFIVQSLIKS